MNKEFLDELLYCLNEDKTVVHYFKDKYCLFLLQQCIKNKTKIQTLKQGPMSHLLQKPVVKKWLATCGGQHITPWMTEALWQQDLHHFTLTLGSWGGDEAYWQQTCRSGYNLVLQLNFAESHKHLVNRVLKEKGNQFKSWGHPTHENKQTLAWARLDVADDLSEVLIEEVQNDWLRKALNWHRYLSKPEHREKLEKHGFSKWEQLDAYVKSSIEPLVPIWHEAMLCATLEFIRNQLGAAEVYMYEHETGCALKEIDGNSQPPRSLYTKLPKQFGFKLTHEAPNFLKNERMVKSKIKRFEKKKPTSWFYLNFNELKEMKHAS